MCDILIKKTPLTNKLTKYVTFCDPALIANYKSVSKCTFDKIEEFKKLIHN